jgi:hypothetical protein
MVAPAAAKAASNTDATMLLIGAGALLLLAKWGFDQIPREALDKVNIVPEAKEFLEGVTQGEPEPIYIAQETVIKGIKTRLSPNPPLREWWQDFGDLEADQRPPILVEQGMDVPTPPVLGIPETSTAQKLGIFVHELPEAFTPEELWADFKRDISFGRWR